MRAQTLSPNSPAEFMLMTIFVGGGAAAGYAVGFIMTAFRGNSATGYGGSKRLTEAQAKKVCSAAGATAGYGMFVVSKAVFAITPGTAASVPRF